MTATPPRPPFTPAAARDGRILALGEMLRADLAEVLAAARENGETERASWLLTGILTGAMLEVLGQAEIKYSSRVDFATNSIKALERVARNPTWREGRRG